MYKRVLNNKLYWKVAFHCLILTFILIYDETLYRGFHAGFEWASKNSFFLFKEITRHRHWEFFDEFGNIWVSIFIFSFLCEYDKEKRKHIHLFLIAIFISTLSYMLIQHITGKLRPAAGNGAVTYLPLFHGFWMSGGLSFPSGHTTFAFCMATFLSYLYPKRKQLFFGIASACGISRVVFKAHFFSEIYAGALLGYTVMAVVIYILLEDPSGCYSFRTFNERRQHSFLSRSISAEGIRNLNQSVEPLVSVIVPVKDEAENIPTLAGELDSVLSSVSWNYEILWIDDGSTDGGSTILDELCSKNPHHRAIHFTQNVGQSAAMWLGFQKSRGAILVTLDGDGQNDPHDIPTLVEKVLSGETDMANGYREKRRDSIRRIAASRIANAFRNWLTGKTVRDVGCSLRAIRRECVEYLPLFNGMHRFIPTLVTMQGYHINEWPVNHRPRQRGKTKYTIHNRLWVGLLDCFGVFWLRKRNVHKKLRDALQREDI